MFICCYWEWEGTYWPSSSDEALLSPHSVLTSLSMWLSLLLTLGSRISAWVLLGTFLFGGMSIPLWTANSSSSYSERTLTLVIDPDSRRRAVCLGLQACPKIPFWRRGSASAVCGNTAGWSTTAAFSGTWHTVVCTWPPQGWSNHLGGDSKGRDQNMFQCDGCVGGWTHGLTVCTSEQLLCKMKRVSKVKVSVVEQVADGAFLLRSVVVRKLWQKATKMLPLRIWQDFTPRAFAHHREENLRLLKTQCKGQKK